MTLQYENHYCVLEIVSPMHIESGDDYAPTDYAYLADKNKIALYDKAIFLQYMLNKEGLHSEFLGHCKKNNLSDITSFLDKHVPLSNATYREIEISGGALSAKFANKKRPRQGSDDLPQVIKAGSEIEPIIVGSSIKGAFRTLLINTMERAYINEKNKEVFPEYKDDDFDIFREIKFSDFSSMGDYSLLIDQPIRLSDKRGMTTPAEWHLTTRNHLNMAELLVEGTFIGTISVNTKANAGLFKKKIGNFNSLWEKFFVESAKYFGDEESRFKKQIKSSNTYYADFEKIPNKLSGNSVIQRYLSNELTCGENEILFKLGKHTGKRAKMSFGEKKFQSSIWLSSYGLPLGWVKIREISEAEYKEMQEQRNKYLVENHEKWEEQYSTHLVRLLREEQEKKEKMIQQQEEERKKLEEFARLEAMTEVERIIDNIQILVTKLPQLEGNVSTETDLLFSKLDSFSEEEKLKAAIFLKETWTLVKRWGKDVSKKQKEKVLKVEQILGEK